MSDGPAAVRPSATAPAVALDARELELARLEDGSVVAKRGMREVLLSDAAAGALLIEVAELLDGTRSAEDVLAAVAPERRGQAVQILRLLLERRLLPDAGASDSPQARFWSSFGAYGAPGPERLRSARVTVLGGGALARTLVEQLVASGVGTIDVVPEPALTDSLDAVEWLRGRRADARVRRVDPAEANGAIAGCTLLCATGDGGLGSAMADANRAALAAGVPFLPIWIADLAGHVGPLTEPFETACLRCYELRVESNSDHPDVVRALREQREPGARDSAGFLPPMAAAVSAIAAMEVLKRIAGVAPSDTVGRAIEINLVSFECRPHRVLKLPRCPDCSDIMRMPSVALTVGPQVPGN
jgi:bacteriocin biosynthesis cyclodehydratase domain-containing protein